MDEISFDDIPILGGGSSPADADISFDDIPLLPVVSPPPTMQGLVDEAPQATADIEAAPASGGLPEQGKPGELPRAGFLETAKMTGEAIKDAVVYHLPGAVGAATEFFSGEKPGDKKDWKDTLIERANERGDLIQKEYGKGPTLIPGISREDFAGLGPSLGQSAIPMVAGVAAGVPAGVGVGLVTGPAAPVAGPIAGYAAGTAAAGVTAYGLSVNQFERQLRKAADEEHTKRTGAPMTDAEFSQKVEKLRPLINEYGLWEAIPEAAGSALGFKILKAPVKDAIGKVFGQSLATRLVSKSAAVLGTELATETITHQGQHNVEVDAGLSKDQKRSWVSADLGESFKDVAGATVLQTAIMGAGTKGAMMLQERIKRGGLSPAMYDYLMDLNANVENGRFSPEQAQEIALKRLDPNSSEYGFVDAKPRPDGAAIVPPEGQGPKAKNPDDEDEEVAAAKARAAEMLQKDIKGLSPEDAAAAVEQAAKEQAAIDELDRLLAEEEAAPAKPAPEINAPSNEGEKINTPPRDASGNTMADLEDDVSDRDIETFDDIPKIPTPKQAEAGNYPKRKDSFQGIPISVETEEGGTRRGKSPDGTDWENQSPAPYGYVRRTEGADSKPNKREQFDVFVGPNKDSDRVFIVDQNHVGTSDFDEHKGFLGYDNPGQAIDVYNRAFSDGKGQERIRGVTETTVAEFKAMLASGKISKALVDGAERVEPAAGPKPLRVIQGEDGMEAHIYQNADGKRFNVTIVDTDSGQSLPSVRIVGALEAATVVAKRALKEPVEKLMEASEQNERKEKTAGAALKALKPIDGEVLPPLKPGEDLEMSESVRTPSGIPKDKKGPTAKQMADEMEGGRKPAGPRVMVNTIGKDGLTDAERKAGKAPLNDDPPFKMRPSVRLTGEDRRAITRAIAHKDYFTRDEKAALKRIAKNGQPNDDDIDLMLRVAERFSNGEAAPAAAPAAKPASQALTDDERRDIASQLANKALRQNSPYAQTLKKVLARGYAETPEEADSIETATRSEANLRRKEEALRPAKKGKAAPAQKAKPDWTEIGKNADGETLYEDGRGVRSKVKGNIRITESVGMQPTRGGGMEISTNRQGEPEWHTAAEWAAILAKRDTAIEKMTDAELAEAIKSIEGVTGPEDHGYRDITTRMRAEQEKRTAPVGVDDRELKQIVAEFNDAQSGMMEGEHPVTNIFQPPAKKDVVRLNDKVKVYTKDNGWMTPAEAKAKIAEWKKHAAAQGKTNKNSDKVVLSLFDRSGAWSQPWEDAGYQVYRFDIQNDPEVGDVNNFSTEFFADWFGDFDGQDIYAILAANPCTDFAVSGARHFAAKDNDGRTVASVKLVHQTLATIEHFKPAVWAIENPVGRIEDLGGLPPWRLSFDPNHIGDPYTKKTLLWGRFNADLPVAPVEPTEGSKMWAQYGGKSQTTKNARSVTPEGFSYGFFMANNAADHPAMAIANKYDRLDRGVIEKAVAAGVTPEQIDSAVEDFYYQDLDDAGANKAIRDLTAETRAAPAADPDADIDAALEAAMAESFGEKIDPKDDDQFHAQDGEYGWENLGFTNDGREYSVREGVDRDDGGTEAWRQVRIYDNNHASADDVITWHANTIDALDGLKIQYATNWYSRGNDNFDQSTELDDIWKEHGPAITQYLAEREQKRDPQEVKHKPRALAAPERQSFDPASHIQIAADDLASLRKQDVERLFDEVPDAAAAKELRDYIKKGRADLAAEVDRLSPAPAQQDFFSELEKELKARQAWASDADKLAKFMDVARNNIGNLDISGEAVKAAWRAVGGKGQPTYKALRKMIGDQPRAYGKETTIQPKGTRAPEADLVVPPGYTLQGVSRLPRPVARQRGAEFTAVVNRDTPFSSERGYGNTPEDAIADAVDRIAKDGRSATQVAGSAIKNTAGATVDVIDAIGKLFGGNKLSMGVSFDKDTYEAAKPLFKEAVSKFKIASNDVAELARRLIAALKAKGYGQDVIQEMMPYLKRFIADVRAGVVDLANDETKDDVSSEENADADDTGTAKPDQEESDGVSTEEGGRPESGKPDGPGRRDSDDGEGGEGSVREPESGGSLSGPRGGGNRPGGIPDGGKGQRPLGGAKGGNRGGGSRVPKKSPGSKGSGGGTAPVAPEEIPNIPGVNFRITPDLGLGKGSELVKFNDNIAAIRAIKSITAENRRATPEEQRVLARYVGWGGLANAFADNEGNFRPGWAERGQELADLLTPEELSRARSSTRNAHYTSETVVRSMWSAAERLGFKGGLALELSAGTGNFLGMVPESIAGRTRFLAIEYDPTTAAITKALYPQDTVINAGTHTLPIPDGEALLSIGNPPFGSESLRFQYKPEINSYSIHNQFFLAGLDALRPGGLQIMVVSRYLMDAKDKTARVAIAQKAELIGAIRLPDTAFKENARTEVVTDILFLRRRWKDLDAKDVTDSWVETSEVKDPLGGDPITVGTYFRRHPEMIAGTLERSGSMRTQNDVTVRLDKDANLAELLERMVNTLPASAPDTTAADLSLERHQKMGESLELAATGAEPGQVQFSDDGKLQQVYERETPNREYELARRDLVPVSPWSKQLNMDSAGNWFSLEPRLDAKGQKVKEGNRIVYDRKVYADGKVPAALQLGLPKFQKLKELVGLRDLTKRQIVLETQDAPAAEMEANRKKLAAAYKAFVAKNGFVNLPANQGLLSEMPDGALVSALEFNYRAGVPEAKAKRVGEKPVPPSVTPAPIMERRVVPKFEPVKKSDTPADAIATSLSELGRVDMVRIAGLLGVSEEQAADLLSTGETPLVYKDPETNTWETRDNYLSGQVARKLKAAEAAGLTENAKALAAVQPEPWTAESVQVMVASTWVPPKIYADFIKHLVDAQDAIVQFLRTTNSFAVHIPHISSAKELPWRTEAMPFHKIFNGMLNSRVPKVTWTDSDGKTHVDQEASALVVLKAKEIENEFADWVFANGDRRNELTAIFNEKFNTRVHRQHDGSHLKLPGKVPDTIIKMRRHQMNAIWRGIYERFMLLDHVVGAGKTFTAIARAMERRRMGLSRKPMIVVPNHLVDAWTADVYRLYPGAKVLAAGSKKFDKKNRRRLFAQIATGDWDIVIVPHSSFFFVGIAKETELRYLEKELALAEAAIKEAQEQADVEGISGGRGKPYNVKEAERLKTTIEGRIEALANKNRDNLLTFEQMGVDDLTVDEAHEFKNLFYSSRLTGVAGMGDKTGSKKAFDLYNKIRVLRESPTGTVTFLTGTPISNSAVEMYSMMRYLAAEELSELGLEHFDAWRAQSVSASAEYEPTEQGGLKEKTRLGRSWSNMRAMMEIYYKFTDSVSQDDINKWYLEDNNGKKFPIPGVVGGGRKEVVVKPTPVQTKILQEVIADFNGLPNISNHKERNDQRLRLMDRARKVSLDARAVDPKLDTDEKGGKLETIAEDVHRLYKKWDADKGTQLIFLDRSVEKSKSDNATIKAYDALIAKRDKAMAEGNEDAYRATIDALEEYSESEIAELKNAQAGGWNAYRELKKQLMARGIPANEIRFVQEANNDAEKKALFDAVNDGEIRVLIGSTPRMGAGTNVQERLVGLHHADVTWKPSDIEQREGRIIRQGNKLYEKYGENFEVEIKAYVTERTIDAKMWSLNATKLRMINGIRKYDGSFTMEFEDEDAVGMAEIAALASGDPLLLERVKLLSEIEKMELQERGHRRRAFGLEDRIESLNRVIEEYPKLIEREQAVSDLLKPPFAAMLESVGKREVQINGETYRDVEAALVAAEAAHVAAKADSVLKDPAVVIDGQRLTTKEDIGNAITTALGDKIPFEATVEGQTTGRRAVVARFVQEKIEELKKEAWRAGQQSEAVIGEMLGQPLVVYVEHLHNQGLGGDLAAGVALQNGKDTVVSDERNFLWTTALSLQGARALLDTTFERAKAAAQYDRSFRERKIEEAKAELPTAQAERGKPFAQAEALATARDRLKTVIETLAERTKAEEGRGPTNPDNEVASILGDGAASVAYTPEYEAKRVGIERRVAEVVARIAGAKNVNLSLEAQIPIRGTKGWGTYGDGLQTAAGFYKPTERMIVLALSDPRYPNIMSTAFHEAFHAVEDLLMTDAELATLKSADRGLRAFVATRYAAQLTRQQVDELADYEVRAIAFQAYAYARSNEEPVAGLSGVVRRAFNKVLNLINSVRNVLRGAGFKTVDQVFSDVYEGKMAKRTAMPRGLNDSASVMGEGNKKLAQFIRGDLNAQQIAPGNAKWQALEAYLGKTFKPDQRKAMAHAVEKNDLGVLTPTERAVAQRLIAAAPVAPAAAPPKQPIAAASPPPPPPPRTPPAVAAPAAPPANNALGRVLARIVPSTDGQTRMPSLREVYTATKDDLNPIRVVRDALVGGRQGNRWSYTGAKDALPVKEDPLKLARLVRGAYGKAQQMLENGTFAFDDLSENGEGLVKIIKPFENDMDGLRAYMVSRRVLELDARGIETGVDVADAQAIVTAGNTKYAGAFGRIVAYQRRVLDYLKDSGVLSEEAYDAMLDANKDYVPFFRLMEEDNPSLHSTGRNLKVRDPVRGIKGSDRKIIDPIESMIKNTFLYVALAEKNRVLTALNDLAERSTLGEDFLRKPKNKVKPITVSEREVAKFLDDHGMDPTNAEAFTIFRPQTYRPAPNEIAFFKDGKRQIREVDPELANAINALDRETLGWVMQLLAAPARLLRAGATLAPEFIVRNPVRDQFTAFVFSENGYVPVWDMLRGLGGILRKDQDYQNWLKSGGANSTLISIDRDHINEQILQLQDPTFMSTFKNVVKSPIMLLRLMSELMENATRVGEFKRALANGKDLFEAGYGAREATLDFARMGAQMKAMNAITAFFNANLEGTDREVRGFVKRPMATSLKVAGAITLPSILLWWANHDDDRYKQLARWEKDLFWHILTDDWVEVDEEEYERLPTGNGWKRKVGDKWFRNNGSIYRIPKPFALGILFGSVPERVLDAFVDKRPRAFKELTSSLVGALTPPLVPTGLVPIVEQIANKSLFTGAPIVPRYLEDVLSEHKAQPFTSATAKLVGKTLSRLGMDENSLAAPLVLDNYIRGWTGGLGRYATGLVDKGIIAAGLGEKFIEPTPTNADTPLLRAFATRFPSAQAQSVQDFYDMYDSRKKAAGSVKLLARAGKADEARELRETRSLDTAERLHKALGEQHKFIRGVNANREMSPDEKRKLIDLSYLKMIQAAQRGIKMFEETDARKRLPQ